MASHCIDFLVFNKVFAKKMALRPKVVDGKPGDRSVGC